MSSPTSVGGMSVRAGATASASGRPLPEALSPAHRGATLTLFFLSGFAGLVYEVLWMKELGLLFGNTAHAAATTLAAFFLGLVIGARFWGGRVGRFRRPLRTYAWLEAGVALSALLYFVLLDAYHGIYSALFEQFGESRYPFLAVKFLLALGVLLPPSFFMGGTLPVMSQHLIRSGKALGRTGSLLYAVNTAGAAGGAYVAGFHLPRLLGYDLAYGTAISVTVSVAVLAWLLERRTGRAVPEVERATSGGGSDRSLGIPWSPRTLGALAFFSGFATLGLEVLWTRMFAQVLQNSVYTFSTILVTFLLALALGGGLASWLIRKAVQPAVLLPGILVLSGVLVALTPFLFHWLTDGLEYFGGERAFGAYVLGAFGCAFAVMLVPGVVLGSLFPYLLRLAEPFARTVGKTVGDLSAINTLGAVCGSVVAGFVLLDLFGLWASIRLVSVLYLCAALLAVGGLGVHGRLLRSLPIAAILLVVTVLDPSRLPVVYADPVGKGESVLRTWEGSSGIISVVRQPTSLTIKMDNDYSLGGTGAARYEEGQAHLPLWIHPAPERVFFLGMGTGITAGAALLHPVERVVVSELSPDVVEAARTFFAPYLHGLFEDERVTIVAEDGRNYLLGTSQAFDLVIADLFMTWKSGVGSLYSLEHYRTALDKLRPGGLYVQWLPLYQVSRREFGVVARTMVEVFPLVTLWRGAIEPGWETAAIVGHRERERLDRSEVLRRLRQSREILAETAAREGSSLAAETDVQGLDLEDLLVQYCGNLTMGRGLVSEYRVNTDDRPVIEYEAPVTHRRTRSGDSSWFVGGELIRFLGELLAVAPPAEDPYMQELSPRETRVVEAGLKLYLSRILSQTGDEDGARQAMQDFESLYAQAGEGARMEAELAESRRELLELITKYEQRIDALREHVREVDEAAAARR